MHELDRGEGARMLLAALADQLDRVAGHVLALLAQDRDHVHPGARAERGEQRLHRVRRRRVGTAVERERETRVARLYEAQPLAGDGRELAMGAGFGHVLPPFVYRA